MGHASDGEARARVGADVARAAGGFKASSGPGARVGESERSALGMRSVEADGSCCARRAAASARSIASSRSIAASSAAAITTVRPPAGAPIAATCARAIDKVRVGSRTLRSSTVSAGAELERAADLAGELDKRSSTIASESPIC
jgi:hypothetical protein